MGQIFLLLIATLIRFNPSLVDEWQLYVDPGGAFEVEMPDSVTVDVQSADTPVGKLEIVMHQSDEIIEDKIVRYSVSFCDYPDGTFPADSIDLISFFLEETVNATASQVGGELMYVTDLADASFPTKLCKIVAANGAHIKSKAILVKDRYYNLEVITPEILSVHNDSDRFFRSFKLLDP